MGGDSRWRHDPEGARCCVGALWARLFLRKGWALTAGGTIWFKCEEDFERYLANRRWRYHEQHHLVQERERFKGRTYVYLLAFVWEYLRYGHDRAPLEIEAEVAADLRLGAGGEA